MTEAALCPECEAPLQGRGACLEYFHQMGYWELSDLEVYGVNHHLMVLCYYLQHPGLYSQQGLLGAVHMLVEFVERNAAPSDMRQQIRRQVDSSIRKFKIAGTPEDCGRYPYPVRWQMTAADVVTGGIDQFVENLKIWSVSVYNSLKASGNLPANTSSAVFTA